MQYIKIWGLKRSGTNYLRWWLENNFKDVTVLMDILGWKHGPPTRVASSYWKDWYPEWCPLESPISGHQALALAACMQEGSIPHVAIVKDPIAWIDSMRRFEIKRGKISGLLGLVKDWNERVAQYRDFGCPVVRYESLLSDRTGVQAKLAELTGLEPTEDSVWHSGRFERGNDGIDADECIIPQTVDIDYYLSRKYLDNFTQTQTDEILGALDMDLVRDFLHYDDLWEDIKWEQKCARLS